MLDDRQFFFLFLKKEICVFLIITAFGSTISSGLANNFPVFDELNWSSPAPFTDTKIFIHFDKNHYRAGETIWFKIYVLDGYSHKPKKENEIVYLDLFDSKNQIITTKIIKTVKGFGDNNLNLSPNVKEGIYSARAYTRQILEHNPSLIFEKKIVVGTVETNSNSITESQDGEETSYVNLFFFSEGNTISDGLVTKIGVKSLNKCGLGVSVSGEIRDGENKPVAAFTTSNSGLGTFSFLWEKTSAYKVWITRKEKMIPFDFHLEDLASNGFSAKLIEHSNHYRMNLEALDKRLLKGLSFKIRQREGLVDFSDIATNASEVIIKIPKKNLNEGVFFFELLDSKDSVLMERMGYHLIAQEKHTVNILPSKTSYQPGETIALNIIVAAADQIGEFGNASLSVFEKKVKQSDYCVGDIKKYLLLDSELIDYTNQSLTFETRKEKENIEKVLLTHKWKRKFCGSHASTQNLHREKGITIRGILKMPGGQIAPNHPVELMYKNEQEIGYETKVTNALGQFVFDDLQFSDTTKVRLRSKSVLGYSIALEEFSPLKKALLDYSFVFKSIDCATKTDLALGKRDSEMLEETLGKRDTIQLQEVKVKARKPASTKNYDAKRILYTSASQTLDFENLEDLTNPLLALSGRVSGLTYRIGQGIFLRSPNSINGSGRALVLLNGSPSDISAIESLPFSDIDFIDILKGYKASIFGSAGVNGVIAIYTKGATKNINKAKTESGSSLNIIHPGFGHSVTFNSNLNPTQGFSNPTIMWLPNVLLNQQKTTVSLKAPGTEGIFEIVLQGISNKGAPILAKTTIQIAN